MKKIIFLMLISLLLISCNNEVVNEHVNIAESEEEHVEVDEQNLNSNEENINVVDADKQDETDEIIATNIETEDEEFTSKYNHANDGIALFYDDVIFYSDFRTQNLVRVNINEDHKMIISDKIYFDLHMYDGWIYGTAFEPDGLSYLYRVKPNGTNEEKSVDEEVMSFQILGDDLIYSDVNGSIMKLSLLNNDVQLIHKTGVDYLKILVFNGWIYYFDHFDNHLKKINPYDGEVITLFEQSLKSFIVDKDDNIYYLTEEGLVFFDSGSMNHNLIISGLISSFNIFDEVIYYCDYSTKTLHSYDLLTEKTSVVANKEASRINIGHNNIVFVSSNDIGYFTEIINETNNEEAVVEEEIVEKKTKISYEYSNAFMERKYYSPDGSHYVTEKIDGTKGNAGSYINYLYLDSAIEEIGILYQDSIGKNIAMRPIVWLDDSSFVIGGKSIYNIEKKGISEYILKDLLDNSYLFDYAINLEGTKIVYSIIDNSDYIGKILIYDIETGSMKIIHEYEKVFTWSISLRVEWDSDENIYFETSYSGDDYQVFKYDQSSGTVEVIHEGAIIINVSEDGRYIVIGDFINHRNEIIDTIDGDSHAIDYSIDIAWIDDHTFVSHPLHNYKSITIYKLNDDSLDTIKSVDLTEIEEDNKRINNLRFENNILLIDVVEFASYRYKTNVIEAKTYRINLYEEIDETEYSYEEVFDLLVNKLELNKEDFKYTGTDVVGGYKYTYIMKSGEIGNTVTYVVDPKSGNVYDDISGVGITNLFVDDLPMRDDEINDLIVSNFISDELITSGDGYEVGNVIIEVYKNNKVEASNAVKAFLVNPFTLEVYDFETDEFLGNLFEEQEEKITE